MLSKLPSNFPSILRSECIQCAKRTLTHTCPPKLRAFFVIRRELFVKTLFAISCYLLNKHITSYANQDSDCIKVCAVPNPHTCVGKDFVAGAFSVFPPFPFLVCSLLNVAVCFLFIFALAIPFAFFL